MMRSVALLLMAGLASACAAPSAAADPSPTPSERTQVVTGVTRSGASAAPSRAPGGLTALVELGDHWYLPSELTVQVGTTVTWKMVGSQEHDIWAYDGSFHSPTLGPGMSYTFTKAGTFKYFCVPHFGDGMQGSVTIVERR